MHEKGGSDGAAFFIDYKSSEFNCEALTKSPDSEVISYC